MKPRWAGLAVPLSFHLHRTPSRVSVPYAKYYPYRRLACTVETGVEQYAVHVFRRPHLEPRGIHTLAGRVVAF